MNNPFLLGKLDILGHQFFTQIIKCVSLIAGSCMELVCWVYEISLLGNEFNPNYNDISLN